MIRSLLLALVLCSLVMAPSLSAAVCPSTTSCSFNLDQATTLGNQFYGTVTLTRVGGTITFNINLIAGYTLIETGAGGGDTFNFNESPNLGGIAYGIATPNTYSGSQTNVGADGQGTFTDGFGTTAPQQGTGSQTLTFSVTRPANPFTDVNQLIALSTNPPGSDQAFFGADVLGPNGTGEVGASSGSLVPQSTVPEPQYVTLLIAGFGCVALVFERRRKNRLA